MGCWRAKLTAKTVLSQVIAAREIGAPQAIIGNAREISCVIEILLSHMYSRMVLMVVCWRYGMPFDGNGCVSTLGNVD